ncbi:MAG: hypothetical protein D6759_18355 [Chloroflexi bacterium]|nr:MAG: hypothetical protein D6759_18355 [Chloroflexota bacterium]
MKKAKFLIGGFAVALLLALAAGFVLAQGPEGTEEEAGATGEVGAAAAMDDKIPIQGQLTDASGTPLTGSYDLTFRLYNAASGGTPLCEDTDSVSVDNGLFFAYMDFCTAEDINGQQLYLGIEVGSDGEMTPRQPIYAVPYAWSLRPGAEVKENLADDPILYLYNTGSGEGLWSTSVDGEGVHGSSGNGIGVGGYSLLGPGVHAESLSGAALSAAGTGVITSTAKSYLWISGNDIRPFHESDGVIIDADTIGGAKIYRGPNSGNKNVMLPISVIGPLYGQDVTVSELEIYFVGATEFDGIAAVLMRRQTGVCSTTSCYATILYDTADHSCDQANNSTGCTLTYSLTQNNVLTEQSGILYLTIELFFSGETTWVEIGGVRLTLEHD